MAWVISESLEPIYIDDNWDNNNSCPVPCKDCGCRFDENGDECYWAHDDDASELDFLNETFDIKF